MSILHDIIQIVALLAFLLLGAAFLFCLLWLVYKACRFVFGLILHLLGIWRGRGSIPHDICGPRT